MAISTRGIPKNDLVSWIEVTKEEDGQQYTILTDYIGLLPWSHAQMQELITELQKTMAHISDEELSDYGKSALLKYSQHIVASQPRKKPIEPRRGYVYILKGDRYYKIGCTTDTKQRLTPMTAKAPFPLETIALIPSEDIRQTEKELHTHFADKHRRGEWYDLDEADLLSIRRAYMTIDSVLLQAN